MYRTISANNGARRTTATTHTSASVQSSAAHDLEKSFLASLLRRKKPAGAPTGAPHVCTARHRHAAGNMYRTISANNGARRTTATTHTSASVQSSAAHDLEKSFLASLLSCSHGSARRR